MLVGLNRLQGHVDCQTIGRTQHYTEMRTHKLLKVCITKCAINRIDGVILMHAMLTCCIQYNKSTSGLSKFGPNTVPKLELIILLISEFC